MEVVILSTAYHINITKRKEEGVGPLGWTQVLTVRVAGAIPAVVGTHAELLYGCEALACSLEAQRGLKALFAYFDAGIDASKCITCDVVLMEIFQVHACARVLNSSTQKAADVAEA